MRFLMWLLGAATSFLVGKIQAAYIFVKNEIATDVSLAVLSYLEDAGIVDANDPFKALDEPPGGLYESATLRPLLTKYGKLVHPDGNPDGLILPQNRQYESGELVELANRTLLVAMPEEGLSGWLRAVASAFRIMRGVDDEEPVTILVHPEAFEEVERHWEENESKRLDVVLDYVTVEPSSLLNRYETSPIVTGLNTDECASFLGSLMPSEPFSMGWVGVGIDLSIFIPTEHLPPEIRRLCLTQVKNGSDNS